MSTKRGCSLCDVACGGQRSVELHARLIKSGIVPIDVNTQSAGLVSVHPILRPINKSSDRTALPLATDRARQCNEDMFFHESIGATYHYSAYP